MAAPLERVALAQPVLEARGRLIGLTAQFATTGEDHLRIVSVNSLAGVTLTIHSRAANERGDIVPTARTHTPNSDRTARTEDFPLAPGALLNLTVVASAGSPLIGQCFVIVQLIRGLGGATIVLGTLLQGYVTGTQHLAWPGSPIGNSLDGQGVLRVITGADPAVGAEALDTVPTGARWELVSYRILLVTSAVAGDRLVRLRLQSGSPLSTTWIVNPATAQGASSTFAYDYMRGETAHIFARGFANQFLPTGVPLMAGAQLQTVTDGLDAGDNFAAPGFVVLEWLEV